MTSAESTFLIWVVPIALLTLLTAGGVLILRWAGLRRPVLAAGIAAGILLGPTVGGRVYPELQKRVFVGGSPERSALVDLERRQTIERMALKASGVSPAAMSELAQQHARESEKSQQSYQEAQHRHQSGLNTLAALAACFVIGCAATGRRVKLRSLSDAAFVVSWTVVVTAGGIGVMIVYALGAAPLPAFLIGITFALFAAPGLTDLRFLRSRRSMSQRHNPASARTCEQPEDADATAASALQTVRSTKMLAWSATVCFTVLLVTWLSRVSARELSALVVLAIPLGMLVRLGAVNWSGFLDLIPRHGLPLICGVVAAAATCRIDVLSSTAIAPILLGFLVGGDVRWLGAATALRLQGRRWYSSFILSAPFADAGAIQTALIYLLWHLGRADDRLVLLALVAAASCDLATNLRGRLLTMLQVSDPTGPGSQESVNGEEESITFPQDTSAAEPDSASEDNQR